MTLNDNELRNDTEGRSEPTAKPNAYRVKDDGNLEEDDLRRSFLFGSDKKNAASPGMEGKEVGGENFGKNNLTPSGNDTANPPRYAGNDNGYFKRTEPAEEHPENTNFKTEDQSGSPDYSSAQPAREGAKHESERSGKNDVNTYQEGTADDDGNTNVPGPNELPDQQKVGEGNNLREKEHIET